MIVNDRLRRWSRAMVRLCLALAVLAPLATAATWLWSDWFRAHWGVFDGQPFPPSGLTPGQRAAGLALGIVPAGLTSFGLVRLAAIFREFAADRAFSEAAVRAFHSFATIIFVLALTTPFIAALEGVILSWTRGPGERVLALTFRAEELRDILFAFLLLALALIFRHGHLLADEQAHML